MSKTRWRIAAPLAAGLVASALGAVPGASAAARPHPADFLLPGNLLVSRSVYVNNPDAIVAGQTVLPPGCTTGCAVANASAAYPQVFNNALVDPSFGVTSRVFLDQVTPFGRLLSSLPVPAAGGLVTS